MFIGLNDEEVKERKIKYGENIIKEAEIETFFSKFKEAFGDPMIRLLIGIACILGIMAFMKYAEWGELVGIIISVLLVTFISAKTEIASDNEYRKIKSSIKKDLCKVYRNGSVSEIIIDDIVVGDLVVLQSGDKIPADGLLIHGELSVDNSALNGEPEECGKIATGNNYTYFEEVAVTGDTFIDNHSLFRGAVVINGYGVLEVKQVGMNTVMGSMAEDMANEDVESPLKVKLTDLASKISRFGYVGAIVIALAFMTNKIIIAGGVSAYLSIGYMYTIRDLLEAIMLAVVIIVMAVPEGLPLMIAIVLMRNTAKLLRSNVLVRKPIGIETAGSLNILFSDKTGTITKGKLEVVEFLDGELENSYNESARIKELMGLCIGKNTAAIFDANHEVIGGNATDKALLNFLTKDELQKYDDLTVEKIQQFNSRNKYSAAQMKNITVYKGAPEVLLSKATKCVNSSGRVVELNINAINKKIDNLANKAMRILAFGYSNEGLIENNIPSDLIIVGFVCIRDEVRPEAKQAIKEVQNAGIQVVMITGDRKETAIAIAKDSGLIDSEQDIALTSEEFNQMCDGKVKKLLPRIKVIARALPTDKSRMVRLAQELNLVCGMTGDGVNDAPALKRADVGFAMGSGTDVAKEVGDIVVLDDNFKSICNAISYGRTIYNNILKFIKFQLTINIAAVAVSAIAPFIGVESPLGITHILWINLVMDGLGALALGGEPVLKSYMEEKPKSRTQSLISKKLMIQVLVSGTWVTALSLIFLKSNYFVNFFGTKAIHMTAYFSLFILIAVANGFNVRSEDINIFENIYQNKSFIKVMGIIILVQITLTYIGGDFFSCTPLGLKHWLLIGLLATTIIPVDMARKIVVKSLSSTVSEMTNDVTV